MAARISLAPPGDSSPPVIDDSPAVSALSWPHQAAEALEAASVAAAHAAAAAHAHAASQQQAEAAESDVDSLLGLASAAASASSATSGSGTSAGSSRTGSSSATTSKFALISNNKPQILDNVERRANALAILKLICDSPVFLHRLEAILSLRDAQGNTPFMAAVANRYDFKND